MANIKGNLKVILQPGDTKYGVSVKITTASSSTANDGFLRYGQSVSSVSHTITKVDSDGTDYTTELTHTNPTVVNNVVYIELKYNTTAGTGRYKITFVLTLSDGGTRELDFTRLYLLDE